MTLHVPQKALKNVTFYEDSLLTFEHENEHYVAMRRICENIGIAWQGQHVKLMDQKDKFSCHDIMTTGSDGKQYKMLCMPVSKFPLWLATINPNKISNPDVKAKIIRYQDESAEALYNYWFKGEAKRDADTNAAAEPMLDAEPLSVISMKLALVREARHILGVPQAKALWYKLGLPSLPALETVPGKTNEDALACLRHLLSYELIYDTPEVVGKYPFAHTIERAMEGSEEAYYDLMMWGIRIVENGDGDSSFWVANYGERLSEIYKDTPWAGRWRYVLKQLDGAAPSGVYKVGGIASRGVVLPMDYLDLRA